MTQILIDGILHNIVDSGGVGIYVDHPDHPGQKCAYHRLTLSDLMYIANGGGIRTGGHVYSRPSFE